MGKIYKKYVSHISYNTILPLFITLLLYHFFPENATSILYNFYRKLLEYLYKKPPIRALLGD